MTIRLRCAACKRKLKVPDEALGKKVQCPACGARFRGQIEPEPPRSRPEAETTFPPLEEASTGAAPQLEAPSEEQPLAETIALTPEEAPAAEVPLDEAPLVDTLFAEMASHPLPDVALPPESPRNGTPPASPFVNLELDESPVEAEPAASEQDDMVILDDSTATEPIMLGGAEAADPFAAPEEEPIEIVDEVGEEEVLTPPPGRKPKPSAKPSDEEPELVEEEDEPAQGGKPQKAKKSRKGLLIGFLGGGLVVGLLACGGIGFAVYRYFNEAKELSVQQGPKFPPPNVVNPAPIPNPGSEPKGNPPPVFTGNLFPDSEWKQINPPGSRCVFQMPGYPKQIKEPDDPAIHFQLERQPQGCVFEVAYFDMPVGQNPVAFLNETMAGVEKQMLESTGGKIAQKGTVNRPGAQGRQLVITGSKGETYITQLYVTTTKANRVYQLMVQGPKIQSGRGDSLKFLNSFKIN